MLLATMPSWPDARSRLGLEIFAGSSARVIKNSKSQFANDQIISSDDLSASYEVSGMFENSDI